MERCHCEQRIIFFKKNVFGGRSCTKYGTIFGGRKVLHQVWNHTYYNLEATFLQGLEILLLEHLEPTDDGLISNTFLIR